MTNEPEANPYAAPTTVVREPRTRDRSARLASRSNRFWGAAVDGLVTAVPLALILVGEEDLPMMLGAVGFGALLLINLMLLLTRAQTIGKVVIGTKIVASDGGPATWVQLLVMRGLLNGLLQAIPLFGNFYAIIDALFIFREDRRCIHDHIAGTIVVDA